MGKTAAARRRTTRQDRALWRIAERMWFWCAVLAVAGGGCNGTPALVEQEQLVRNNDLQLDRITTRAVVNVWGEPLHYRSKFTQFFVMPDRTMIPASRVALGESPRGWNAGLYAGEGVFFAYPDRGWLLVFLDDRLVYKEQLTTDEMQALVKAWAYEDRFKTRLDGSPFP